MEGIDTGFMKELKTYYTSDEYRRYYNSAKMGHEIFPISPCYYNGSYYMTGNHNLINKDKDTLNIHCLKVFSYNNEDFTEYVGKKFKDSWDHKNNFFFREDWWMPLPDRGIIKGEQDGKMIEFNMSDYYGRMLNDRTRVDLDNIPVKKGSIYETNKEVKYFEKDSILFVYLDKMSEDASFYDKIKLEGRNKFIKKVIIDVRDNRGGNDLVWHNTLRAIIKDTLPYPAQIAFNDNKLMRDKLINYGEITRFEIIQYLDNRRYGIISDTTMTLAPDSNSLKYGGKIYILTNRGTYSSAHSLVSYADYLDNLVSVGESKGQIVGFGIMAQLFQLKYSKFTFRLSTTMDVTHCKKPLDIYHDFPEIEVIPSIEEVLLYPKSGYDIKSEEYLYQYDSMFKKVLELK